MTKGVGPGPRIQKEIGFSKNVESLIPSLSEPRQGQKKGLCTDRDHVDDSRVVLGSWIDGRRFVGGPSFWWEKWIGISPVEILLRVDWQRRLLRSNWTLESRSRSGDDAVEERKRGGRAPGTKGAAAGRTGNSSSSNRRMPGRGRESQTRTQGGAREALEKKAEESGTF